MPMLRTPRLAYLSPDMIATELLGYAVGGAGGRLLVQGRLGIRIPRKG